MRHKIKALIHSVCKGIPRVVWEGNPLELEVHNIIIMYMHVH